jgi:hypothetical protein
MDDETAIHLYLGYAGWQTTGYEDEYNADFGFGMALFSTCSQFPVSLYECWF